ncbi:MAG: 6-carboxytetrahydropterin synthase [Alphaproteobacteria bacterium]
MTLFRRFCFEATHELGDNVPSGHAYGTLHGHSFAVEIEASDGEPALLATAAEALHGRLDHQLLNNIPGLARPTLENIARWIWTQTLPDLPGLRTVTVRRESCGEGCRYAGSR